jgi:AraC family transcriptional regulator
MFLVGRIKMKFTIENKPAFKMFGLERIFSMEDGQNFMDIPAFWQECFSNGSVEALEKVSGINVTDDYEGLLPVNAIMGYKETGDNTLPYMIGCLMQEASNPTGYDVVEIPALKWGVFTTEPFRIENTSDAVQDLWKRIFTEWLPSSKYIMAEGAQLEMYYNDKGTEEFCEIWIPMK